MGLLVCSLGTEKVHFTFPSILQEGIFGWAGTICSVWGNTGKLPSLYDSIGKIVLYNSYIVPHL